jgi:hypothetical protein
MKPSLASTGIFRQQTHLQRALVLIRCGIPQIVVRKHVSRGDGGRLELKPESEEALGERTCVTVALSTRLLE